MMLRFGGVERSGGPNFWIFTLCGAKKSGRLESFPPDEQTNEITFAPRRCQCWKIRQLNQRNSRLLSIFLAFFSDLFSPKIAPNSPGTPPAASNRRYTSRKQNDANKELTIARYIQSTLPPHSS